MQRLIILFIVAISLFVPHFADEAMSQNFLDNNEPFPTMMRFEVQMRRTSPSAGIITPKTRQASYSSVVDFDHYNGSLTANRTLSISPDPQKESLERLTTFIAISKDIISRAPSNLKIDSGLSYFLPVSRHFSAFATLKPSLQNIFTAPHTMVAAGFHIPIAEGRPGGHDISLKFSTAVDQQFRPVIFFTFNLTPFKR